MATNSRRLVRFSILGIAGTIAFASVANADPVGVALVESSNSASVALMDYVQAGQIIRLGPHETIVLSYMSSCLRETITGGTVTVGTDRSDVRFGSVERVNAKCDPGEITLTGGAAIAGRVFRGLVFCHKHLNPASTRI
jgi:hypothetical protein